MALYSIGQPPRWIMQVSAARRSTAVREKLADRVTCISQQYGTAYLRDTSLLMQLPARNVCSTSSDQPMYLQLQLLRKVALMALRTGSLHLPRWRHIPRWTGVKTSKLPISSPHLRAPFSISWPRPKAQSKASSSNPITRSRQLPIKSSQRSRQHASGWLDAFETTRARWRAWYAGSLSHRLIIYGVVVVFSGGQLIDFFVLEQVPITGRRRFSWLSRSKLARLDETERQWVEELRKNEEKLFITREFPGLRKIEAVFDRLVKASGLDNVAWEVRVLDEPCRSSLRSYAAALRQGEKCLLGFGGLYWL